MTQPERETALSRQAEEAVERAEASVSRHRELGPVWMAILVTASSLSVLASIYFIFNVHLMIGVNIFGEETEYYYFMLAMLLPLVFLLYPPWRGVGPMTRVPWYDLLLSFIVFTVSIVFAVHGEENLLEGWEYDAPEWAIYASYFMWLMVLEATRRAGGMPIFVICLVVSLYPTLAEYAPGFLEGQAESLAVTASFHMFGTESVMGIPMRAFASLVVGFLIFGVALQFTGGGAFFLNLAFALLGRFRGGPAKVAIFSSGLMGSMSGSVITNVLTTGALSIPAMKRVGFRPAYAGGVEACASTGGVLMPPVMGATAFIMATFLEISYAVILVAAIIPSLLYYFSLFMQIDAYSARFGLTGLPKAEMPQARQVMRDGWHFIFVLALLIVMLLVMQQEAQAPYYAAALLIVINQVRAHDRWDLERCKQFLIGIAKLFTELAGILAGVGLIIGALMLTGKVGNLSLELVSLAGDSIFVLLVMGAITSFILGMGMTVTAAYLFLAIALAPALTASGRLDLLAVHLYMMYWGMISFITPPVALGAFAAATVARANPITTGFEAMRLGAIIYFVPFFFVLNPALIGHGSTVEVITVCGLAFAGVVLISGALQGYLIGIGSLTGNLLATWPIRLALFLSGLLLALPGGELTGYTHTQLLIAAAVLGVPAAAAGWLMNRRGTARMA